MGMNAIILWFSLCEAVDQLQAEGIEFKVKPDELIEKWSSVEAQDRVKFKNDDEEEISIIIEEEIN